MGPNILFLALNVSKRSIFVNEIPKYSKMSEDLYLNAEMRMYIVMHN